MRLRRDPRYLTDLREPKQTVQFHDFQGVERTCPVRDFSRQAFIPSEDGSLIFRIGDILRSVFLL